MSRFKTKVEYIEAVQLKNDNQKEIRDFVKNYVGVANMAQYMVILSKSGSQYMAIGEWVIKVGDGDYMVVSNQDFNKLYEPA